MSIAVDKKARGPVQGFTGRTCLATTLLTLMGTAPTAAFQLSAGADPLARDIVTTCDDAIARGDVPSEDGWQVTGPTPAEQPYANSETRYADKAIDGVGNLHLSLLRTVVGDDRLSHCSLTVMDPARRMPIADFGKADGLAGAVSDTQGAWFNQANTMIIMAMTRTQPNGFLFSMDVIAPAAAAQ